MRRKPAMIQFIRNHLQQFIDAKGMTFLSYSNIETIFKSCHEFSYGEYTIVKALIYWTIAHPTETRDVFSVVNFDLMPFDELLHIQGYNIMLKSPQVDYVDAAIRYAARTSQPEANNEALYMVNRNKQLCMYDIEVQGWQVMRTHPNMFDEIINMCNYYNGLIICEESRSGLCVHILNISRNTVISIPKVPATFGISSQFISSGSWIFVIGGGDIDGQLCTTLYGLCHCYTNNDVDNPGADGATATQPHVQLTMRWRKLSSLIHTVKWPVIVATITDVYVLGGVDNEGTATTHMQVYNRRAGSWRLLPNLPETCNSDAHSAVVFQDKLIVFKSMVTMIYDILEEMWTSYRHEELGDYINAFVHRDEIYVNVHTKWRGGDSILYTHNLDNFSWIRLSHINMDSCLHHKLLFSL